MKKHLFLLCAIALSMSAVAQQSIHLRSTDKVTCEISDITRLKASFSFSGIEARELQCERGVFSTLTMPNTVVGGNEGEPQIPVYFKAAKNGTYTLTVSTPLTSHLSIPTSPGVYVLRLIGNETKTQKIVIR